MVQISGLLLSVCSVLDLLNLHVFKSSFIINGCEVSKQ